MGFHNPPMPWSEFERTLSDRRKPRTSAPNTRPDDPPLSRKRAPYQASSEVIAADSPAVPYVELHAHSAFSFLDGASMPELLAEEAHRLRLSGVSITDHDGLYGAVRFAEAAEAYPELLTVYGAELSLELSQPQMGRADPEGSHLLVLARGLDGYHALAGAITEGQLAHGAEKGRPIYQLDDLAEQLHDRAVVLTGCRKGRVRQALLQDGIGSSAGFAAARIELHLLVERFGTENVWVELIDHGSPTDQLLNDALALLATELQLGMVATNNVHYASPTHARLGQAMAAVRARRSLDELDGWLPGHHSAHLRSGAEMTARFDRYPGAINNTVTLGHELSFTLRSARPKLPTQQVPAGHTPMSWLRELVWQGAAECYPGLPAAHRERIERELAVIEGKDFPGYFLIVHDLVHEARRRGILCQGRGSAAASAVCYVLGITAVDAIFYNLPFERFLSNLREEEPDIDVDFDSERREEIIQYVFEKYGRRNAAQVANVISYRPKVAVRDMAKALGFSPGQQDAWSRQVERWGSVAANPDHDIPEPVVELAEQLLKYPRHLGIHSGGMVLTERPVGEVCPIEHARKEHRTVLQWDKDDCAWMGLVKFDLLGLGMLAALARCFDLVHEHLGEQWSLRSIPKEEPGVYDMLCRADAIGVFQVESRAQLATLPRLRPRSFYELACEIALIRPGPVQGDAVHPYIYRKTHPDEPIDYLHESLRPVLERTHGVPIFQEQIIAMGMAIGGLDAAEGDLLRRAMGSKRGVERIDKLREKLYRGMREKGLSEADAAKMYARIEAFADFGFAESHSLSFALLVYASAWLKLHYPAAFVASLLRSQPMGFYSAQTLTADARRHGVEVRRPDVLRSGVETGLEAFAEAAETPLMPSGRSECTHATQAEPGEFDASRDEGAAHRRDHALAVRLGLLEVKRLGRAAAERIVRERPFRDLADLSRRADLGAEQLEALAAAGALDCFGYERREALWLAGEAAVDRVDYLPGTVTVLQPPLLPLLSPAEQTIYDVWATGFSPDDHPIHHLREHLDDRGIAPIGTLRQIEPGTRIEVAGAVTHRQRPSTAGGITFINLEDETGVLNVVASVGVWSRYRRVARDSAALIIRGVVECSDDGVLNVVADRFEPLVSPIPMRSRDFR